MASIDTYRSNGSLVKIRFLLIGLLSLLFLANTCAAVQFDISPKNINAHPGETVRYNLTVQFSPYDNSEELYPYKETFSIVNKYANWDYLFSKNDLILDKGSTSNTSVLSITVPLNASLGTYNHQINVASYVNGSWNVVEDESINITVNTNIQQVPEFPSIALPVAAVLGLVAIFGRRKEIEK
jgi:hypothetical protein